MISLTPLITHSVPFHTKISSADVPSIKDIVMILLSVSNLMPDPLPSRSPILPVPKLPSGWPIIISFSPSEPSPSSVPFKLMPIPPSGPNPRPPLESKFMNSSFDAPSRSNPRFSSYLTLTVTSPEATSPVPFGWALIASPSMIPNTGTPSTSTIVFQQSRSEH